MTDFPHNNFLVSVLVSLATTRSRETAKKPLSSFSLCAELRKAAAGCRFASNRKHWDWFSHPDWTLSATTQISLFLRICLASKSQLLFPLLPSRSCVLSPLHKNKQSRLLNRDSEGSKTSALITHCKIQLICISAVVYINVVIEIMYLLFQECESGYQWMYDPAVLTGCTYCLHVDTSTFKNLWGPLYNNWGNVSSIEYCKASWPECLEMCTIFF